MRTTINIDDQLYDSIRHSAIEQGVPISRFIENVLREKLLKKTSNAPKVRLKSVGGSGTKPGIDLDNGSSLLEIMDD